jgi:hypothetical protein
LETNEKLGKGGTTSVASVRLNQIENASKLATLGLFGCEPLAGFTLWTVCEPCDGEGTRDTRL